jgi:hypothetical protein
MAGSDTNAYIPESGITKPHFEAFQKVANETGLIIVVRNTNRASTPLIELDCPAKPLEIKFHVSSSTGVVTASGAAEIKTAHDAGYYVVDADRIARREFWDKFNGRQVKQELKLDNVFWKLEPGQLIDGKLKKPLVADYDVMGVIDPKNPGQNIVTVSNNGVTVKDAISPMVRRVADLLNQLFGRRRVMHGAQDQFAGFRGGATAFFPQRQFPNRQPLFMPDELAVEVFYDAINRQTRVGVYASRHLNAVQGGVRRVPARSFVSRLKGGIQTAARDQNAMAVLGQMIGVGIQWLGDIATRRRIQEEIETKHAETIAQALANGEGVLVIILMQEWERPDFNGMRARGFLAVYLEAGPTQEAAMQAWHQPSITVGPAKGWRTFEQYLWIDPTL